MPSELKIPTTEELDYLQATMRAPRVSASDVAGFEDDLKTYGPELLRKMEVSLQRQNDCNADSGASGEEARRYGVTGEMVQLARTYLYNACEFVSGRDNVGRDQGTTIQSAVRVLTEGIKSLDVAPGLPLESDYPYMTYERSASRFAERAQAATIDGTFVAEHGDAPTIEELPRIAAVRGTVHFGEFWGVKFATEVIDGVKYKVWRSVSRGGGGHALEILTVLWIKGAWWPAVWNSHGDGLILMPPEIYEQYRKTNFNPFGGYRLTPDKPVERYYDIVKQGGGWFRPAA